MGRYVVNSKDSSAVVALEGPIHTKIIPAGFMGIFGLGKWKVFLTSGDFTVPDGVSKIRVRVVGGGGGAGVNVTGGAGGGYAHGVFTVSPGAVFPVVVGAAGSGPSPLTSGGTSSFWTFISATGGGAGTSSATPPSPGVGIGGDFQAKGGTSVLYGGGGAAGSQLGDGGSGSFRYGGGAGVGGNDSKGTGGASAFGSSLTWRGAPDLIGYKAWGPNSNGITWAANSNILDSITNTYGINKELEAVIRFPFDGFTGGGGGSPDAISATPKPAIGGNGGGGGSNGWTASYRPAWGGDGGVGGGGGSARTSGGTVTNGEVASSTRGGSGGIGGGGGGTHDPAATTPYGGSMGGQGIVIVEW